MYIFLKNKIITDTENNESNIIENASGFSILNIFNNTIIEAIKLTNEIDFKNMFSNI